VEQVSIATKPITKSNHKQQQQHRPSLQTKCIAKLQSNYKE